MQISAVHRSARVSRPFAELVDFPVVSRRVLSCTNAVTMVMAAVELEIAGAGAPPTARIESAVSP
jgi:hypothetical protein